MALPVERWALAAAAFERSVAVRAAGLPKDLGSGLHELWTRADGAKVAQARLDWAWSIETGRERAPAPDRASWDRAAKWSALADDLMLDWLEVVPDRRGEIAARVTLRGAELLHGPLSEDRGVLLATAHLGPLMAAPVALHESGMPFRWVSSAPEVADTPIHRCLISTEDREAPEVVEAMHRSLVSRQVVLAILDSNADHKPTVPFEGQTICISETGALLIHRTGSAARFLDGRWEDDRMIFEVLPMPEPFPGESAEAYAKRWTLDYLDKIRSILVSGPANLKCRGGLWAAVRSADGAAGAAAVE